MFLILLCDEISDSFRCHDDSGQSDVTKGFTLIFARKVAKAVNK